MKVNLGFDKFLKLFLLLLASNFIANVLIDRFELDSLASWSIGVTLSVQSLKIFEAYREHLVLKVQAEKEKEKEEIKEEKRTKERQRKLNRRKRKI
mmetsp:Transcript_15298/g.18936  ORF Transcript_15298/g.18936 Transcript_15298/m.18936 type:complete len:96 (+) Transcript_15298:434-721(+)